MNRSIPLENDSVNENYFVIWKVAELCLMPELLWYFLIAIVNEEKCWQHRNETFFFAISNHSPEELHRVKGFYSERINPLKWRLRIIKRSFQAKISSAINKVAFILRDSAELFYLYHYLPIQRYLYSILFAFDEYECPEIFLKMINRHRFDSIRFMNECQ